MGNCCVNRVLPAEYAPVTQTPTNKREHQGSLVKMEPEKHKHVSPEPSKSSASPMDQKKPPVKMVKVKSKKRRYVSKIWRKLSRKHRVIPEGCQVQVDTSVVRPQSKMEVLPEHSKSAASPMDQKKPPVKMVKVKSKKRRFVSKIWRKLSRKHHVVPKDPEDAQVQVGSSIERQHSEVEVSPEPPNNTTSPEYQRKHPIRKVKVKSAMHKYGPKVWRKFYRKCHRIPKDSNEAQVQADTSIAKQHSEVEVSPKPPNSATSPEYQRKHPIRKVKVKSRKCRCASKIWRKFLWKCSIVPKDPKGLQVQAGTSTERSKNEIEGSYAPSKSPDSTVDQRNPPVRSMKVISKKCRFVSTLLISRKRPVIPLGVDTPQVVAGPSRKAAQIKTEVVHKNADTALSPMLKVGYTTRRCIPATLREFCEKQATANQDAKTRQMKMEDSALLKRVQRNSMMASKEMPEPNAYNVTTAETTDKKMEELPDHADTTVTQLGPGTMAKVKCKKDNWISSLFKRFWKKTPVTSRVVEVPPAVETTLVRTPEAQRKGLSNVPDIKQFFIREEEFDHYNEGAWEEYQSYFPDGIPSPESRHTMASTMTGSNIAQVGDTDIEDQQNFDSKESFPDAFEVQQWELRKEYSTENPVLNVLFLAPPKSSDEDVVIIKKKRKKKRRCYY